MGHVKFFRWYVLLATLCFAGVTERSMAQAELEVSADFEGGSAKILEVDSPSATIRFAPGGSADRGWVCWWALKIKHLRPGQKLTLILIPSEQPTRNNGRVTEKSLDAKWSMPNRASVSTDGLTWVHSEPGQIVNSQIQYELIATNSTVWIAWGPLFTPRDTAALLDMAVQKLPQASKFELARTRENRSVMGLHVHPGNATAPLPGVWIQARQHAWESGSSWVARGLIEWLTEQSAAATWLATNAELMIVPIMDVDNVTTGNGGKEANPRDHNRDWDAAPVYPEVAAAQKHLVAWAQEQRLDLFIDLHNPAPGDSKPFFFCGPAELLSNLGRDNRALFLGIAQRQINGPLPVEPSPRVTGPSYHPLWRQISGQWVNEHGNSHTNAICLETAWNTPSSTTEGYRQVGRQLGETIAEYLQRRRVAE